MIERPDVDGELARRPGWPSMFCGYLHDEARCRASFAGSWYLTGDVARPDADGWLWFVGRADDVIKSAGHLIGPFEVESVQALVHRPLRAPPSPRRLSDRLVRSAAYPLGAADRALSDLAADQITGAAVLVT